MAAILMYEWYKVGEVKPPAGREVLCQMVGGRMRTATFNGAYWIDPVDTVRLPATDIVSKWMMYEKPPKDE